MILFIRKILLVGLLLLLVLPSTGKAQTFEFGLSPSNVYGIWLNIHSAFTALQQKPQLTQNQPVPKIVLNLITFKEKKPADVFNLARKVQKQVSADYNLGPTPKIPAWIIDYQILEQRKKQIEITPSQVYVLSTQILNSMVKKYIALTNGSKPISQFYIFHELSGKEPSHVYGLVDLMVRRLEQPETAYIIEGP